MVLTVCRSPLFFRSASPPCFTAQVLVHASVSFNSSALHFHKQKSCRSRRFVSFSPDFFPEESSSCSSRGEETGEQGLGFTALEVPGLVEELDSCSAMWQNQNQRQQLEWRSRYAPLVPSFRNRDSDFVQENPPSGNAQPYQQQASQTTANGQSYQQQQRFHNNRSGPYTFRGEQVQSRVSHPQASHHHQPQLRGETTPRMQGRGWNYQRDSNNRGSSNSQGNRFVQQRQREDSRHWLDSKERAASLGEKFLFLSYNILSADNAREHYRELYYHIPMRFVKWDWRKIRLTQEIEYWSPDILCLQEVDRFDDLQSELKKKGYAGFYKARTGASTDGCAIFWKESRFLLLAEETIEFKELGLRDNVAQFCVLRSTASSPGFAVGAQEKRVVVANTHVLFNPKRGDIKLGQVRTLLNTAHELSEAWGGAEVVLGGDFNSTPSSPLYRFISTAELDVSSTGRTAISGQLADGEGYQAYRRPWFRNTWRPPTETKPAQLPSDNDLLFQKKVEVVVEATANHLKVTETVVVATEARKEVEVESEKQLKIIEQSSKELMVVEQASKELMVVETTNSLEANESGEVEAGRWIREVRRDEDSWETDPGNEAAADKRVTFDDNDRDEFDTKQPAASSELQRVLPCGWTVEELINATGSSESTKLSHKLKLRSAYSEIEGKAGSRDASTGEPLATTYHKKFKGTVDYIWHTQGLQPVRVLDLLPVEVLRQTGGLPTQKWGSDHLALVCEMAFLE